MRQIYLIVLIVIIPLLLIGKPFRHLYYPESSYLDSADIRLVPSSIIQSISRDRNIRLIREQETYITDTSENNSSRSYFYKENNPTQIDSIVMWREGEIPDIGYRDNSVRFYYNNANQLISELDGYSYLAIYHLYSKITGFYNSQNRLTDQYEYYGTIPEDFLTSNPRSHIFYNNNTVSEIHSYIYDMFNPTCYYKSVMTNDEQGRIISINNYDSPDSINWNTGERILFTYHANDTMTGELYSINLTESYFGILDIQHSKGFFEGMITEKLYQNQIDGQWYDGSRVIYEYDEANRLTSVTMQIKQNGNWINRRRDLVRYIESNRIGYVSTQYCSGITGLWDPPFWITSYFWEYYTDNEDNAVTPVALNLVAYPNPFSSDINITLQSKSKSPIDAAIYNLKGQLVKSLGIRKSNSFTWDGKDKEGKAVRNGIYLVKAKQDGKTVTVKTLKKF